MPSTSHDHVNHDLREVPPGHRYTGLCLADFDPTPHEPDLTIWPLDSDIGAAEFSGNSDDLVPIYNTVPEPHVRWLTSAQFEHEFGYPPRSPRDTLSPVEEDVIDEHHRLTLTADRLEAFGRLAQLWNGEAVGPNGVHLLADKAPSPRRLFDGLDDRHLDALQPTVSEHDPELVDAFGEYGWFEPQHTTTGWLKSTYIARVPVNYDIEERARTLLNGRHDLPTLAGDPHEGLTHRFGVGVEAARARFHLCRRVETYADVDGYTVDLLEHSSAGERVGEVLTHHHNNELYRSTFEKLRDLQQPAVLVFDTRETARRVLNHWQNRGADVPGAPFDSAPNLPWLRESFWNAARDSDRDWMVEEIYTITQLWDLVFDGEKPAPSRQQLASLNW
jgi:hypothetical protein